MAPDPRQLRTQRFPLHAAVETGDITRVKGLLEGSLRCQINRKYETSGQTPLHVAASCAFPAMVQLLLDYGANVDEVDCVKQTALHYSMTNTRWGVMETLVKAGAKINSRRMKDGWTPVYIAAIFGYSYKVQYLVDNGADVLLCDDRGWSAMDWVARYSLHVVSGVLKQAPRTVTEMSGKKYVEKEHDDKLDVPVEYDEGINKLLAKLEVKRKAKIEEHRKLMLKMDQEKNMERLKLEEKVMEKKSTEENSPGESQEILGLATQNIMNRQRRMILELEKSDETNCDAINKKTTSFKASIDELFAKTAELEDIEATKHSKNSNVEEKQLSNQSISDGATKIRNVKDECDNLFANSNNCNEPPSRKCESESKNPLKTIEAMENAIKSANIKTMEASEGASESVDNQETHEIEPKIVVEETDTNLTRETKISCSIMELDNQENINKKLEIIKIEDKLMDVQLTKRGVEIDRKKDRTVNVQEFKKNAEEVNTCQNIDLFVSKTENADLSANSSEEQQIMVERTETNQNIHKPMMENSEQNTQKSQVTTNNTVKKEVRGKLRKKSETQSCASNSKLGNQQEN